MLVKDNEDICIIKEHIYLIKKGVRSCAWLDCIFEMYNEICKIINQENLMHYEDEINIEDFFIKRIFIYKYPHQLKMFKSCMPYPNTYEKHYILGKLFGYSDDAIEDFLDNCDKQQQIFSQNVSLQETIKKYFDKRFNDETFKSFIKNDRDFQDVHDFFINNIRNHMYWVDFVNSMKGYYFDKYVEEKK